MIKKKLLITGASGFIGSSLISKKDILLKNYDIYTTTRNKSQESSNKIFIDSSFSEKLNQIDVDCVIHLATHYVHKHTQADIKNLIACNVELGIQILNALNPNKKTKFLYTSTCWETFSEKDRTPVNLYALTKKNFSDTLEYFTYNHNIDGRIIYLADSYGEGDCRGKLLSKLIQSSKENVEPLKLSPGEQRLNLLHVEDILDGIILALENVYSENNHIKKYKIFSSENISIKELVDLIEAISKKKCAVEFGGLNYRAREVFLPYCPHPSLPNWKQKKLLVEFIRNQLRKN